MADFCSFSHPEGYDLGAHIGSVFILLGVSLAGCFIPILLSLRRSKLIVALIRLGKDTVDALVWYIVLHRSQRWSVYVWKPQVQIILLVLMRSKHGLHMLILPSTPSSIYCGVRLSDFRLTLSVAGMAFGFGTILSTAFIHVRAQRSSAWCCAVCSWHTILHAFAWLLMP